VFRYLLVLGLLGSTSIAQLCSGFSGGSYSNQALKQEYGPSVFTVDELGTAYLIDATNGYLITANHVLNLVALAKKPLEVWVALPDSQSHKVFPFVILKSDSDLDLALIQIQTYDPLTKTTYVPAEIHKLRPLDITSSIPDSDTMLFVMGYPSYGPQAKIFLRTGDAKFNTITPGDILEVEQLTEGGNSGGPLLNTNGFVVGTCKEQNEGNKIGRYLPTVQMLPLVTDIPVSERMLDLESRLDKKELDNSELKQLLTHNSASPTNLELYRWVLRVVASPKLRNLVAPYLRCPIVPALLERGMLDAAYLFLSEAKNSEKAQISYALGNREYKFGHDTTALQYAKSASGLASQEPDQEQTRILALLLQGRSEERMNLLTEARESYSSAIKIAQLSESAEKTFPEGTPSAQSLLAEAWAADAGAEMKLGHFSNAIRGFEHAEELYVRIGDRRGQYDTRLNIARANQQATATKAKDISANQQATAANKADFDKNINDIEANTKRFSEFSDYEVKDQGTINFNTGSAKITLEGQARLTDLAQTATHQKGYIIEVEGYADSKGYATMNTKLSQARAQAVIDYLVQHGVPIRHITSPGAYGEADPAATNETASGRTENRRVEVRILVNKNVYGK
jgi:outer membrane protein OmpA-like peptidoglycan-associated protein